MNYKFKIPLLPQSINSMYKVNYRTRHVYLSEEARQFKWQAKGYMPPIKFPEGTKFHLNLIFCGNWNYKNGKNRRADVQNLVKILIDAIFEHAGESDDSYVFGVCAYKVQSNTEYTMVKIREADVTQID